MNYSSDEYLSDYEASVALLTTYLKAKGTVLVYAAHSYTVGRYDFQLPTGVEGYDNLNIYRFF